MPFTARLARSMYPSLHRHCTIIRGALPIGTTTLHSAQQHFLTCALRDRVSRFGTIADNRETTNTTSLEVKVRSVPVHDAYKLLQAGNPYLDVRTHDEFNAGHASGAINIPYQFRNGSGMIKNPTFFEQVSSQFKKDDHIVVGCKSGRRSLMAASDMQSAGFTRVTDVSGGYSAWIEHGLPVSKQGH